MTTPWLEDADVTLYHGDVLTVLHELPAESVDCCVTSPPYWGLRDYGQEGQLGLEATPEEYVTRMVEVFREVRRVLAPHGTVWLNLGDSYISQGGSREGYSANTGQGTRREAEPQGRVRATSGLLGGAVGSDVSSPGYLAAPGLKQKDLVGIPWRVAFALQADGWYLRSDIVWSKLNPMPESVTDRPTKAHEYIFLLSKNPRYYFDAEAVREKAEWARWGDQTVPKYEGTETATGWMENGKKEDLQERAASGRNIRSVWSIATQPYPEAHFATFPEELARRCIAAGCPEQVCRVCGKARERVVVREDVAPHRTSNQAGYLAPKDDLEAKRWNGRPTRDAGKGVGSTLGFTSCGHDDYRSGVTLDPFIGSGTVAHVARKLGRHAIGIDLNESYLDLAARRLQQQSLFADAGA